MAIPSTRRQAWGVCAGSPDGWTPPATTVDHACGVHRRAGGKRPIRRGGSPGQNGRIGGSEAEAADGATAEVTTLLLECDELAEHPVVFGLLLDRVGPL